ncbi:polymeric immunoglobulin receptor [Oreochromis niloticus]|uniref:polymeric immunoglobulin receptor n=1 Tax=Oreochromis niloticus TaxID=8128 RepID=UPI00039434B7|nr:polymeric immunoglobulin receptor [Oreochromis niloticus]
MKLLRAVIFFFLSGTTGFVKASIWIGPEGGNLSLYNYLTVSGNIKFFCKEKCEQAENILIKTDGTTAQSGRFKIEYKNASSGRGRLSFAITHMTKSDSGRYRYGLGKSSAPDSYSDIEVRVSNEFNKSSGIFRAQTEGEEISFPCANAVHGQRKFLCKNPCKKGNIFIDTTNDKAENGRYSIKYTKGSAFGLQATIRQLTKSDTGQYWCGYGDPLSPDSYDTDDVFVVEASKPSASTPSSSQTESASRSWDRASNPPDSIQQATTQSHTFTPGLSKPSSDCPGFFLPLVVCVSLVGALLLCVGLLLYYISKLKRKAVLNIRNNDYTIMKLSSVNDD